MLSCWIKQKQLNNKTKTTAERHDTRTSRPHSLSYWTQKVALWATLVQAIMPKFSTAIHISRRRQRITDVLTFQIFYGACVFIREMACSVTNPTSRQEFNLQILRPLTEPHCDLGNKTFVVFIALVCFCAMCSDFNYNYSRLTVMDTLQRACNCAHTHILFTGPPVTEPADAPTSSSNKNLSHLSFRPALVN